MQPARSATALLTRLLAVVAVGVVLLSGIATASSWVARTGVDATAGTRPAVALSTGSVAAPARAATTAHRSPRPALSALLRHERTSARLMQRQRGAQHSQLHVVLAGQRAASAGAARRAVLGPLLGDPPDRPGETAGSRAPPTRSDAAPAQPI